jgi:hypothetical protein
MATDGHGNYRPLIYRLEMYRFAGLPFSIRLLRSVF